MADEVDVRIAEYETVRNATVARIGHRDSNLFLALGVVGALAAYAIKESYHGVLLVIPWALFVLTGRYIHNDLKIDEITDYINKKLAPRLQDLLGHAVPPDPAVFGWDDYHRSNEERAFRQHVQMVTAAVAFVLPGIAALAFYFQKHGLPAIATISWSPRSFTLDPIWAISVLYYSDVGLIVAQIALLFRQRYLRQQIELTKPAQALGHNRHGQPQRPPNPNAEGNAADAP